MAEEAKSYLREIKSINETKKRLSSHVKELNNQKKKAELNLYQTMVRMGVEEFEGIKLKSITPKPPIKRKTLAEKKEEMIKILVEEGVRDPSRTFLKIENARKNITLNETSNNTPSTMNAAEYLKLILGK